MVWMIWYPIFLYADKCEYVNNIIWRNFWIICLVFAIIYIYIYIYIYTGRNTVCMKYVCDKIKTTGNTNRKAMLLAFTMLKVTAAGTRVHIARTLHSIKTMGSYIRKSMHLIVRFLLSGSQSLHYPQYVGPIEHVHNPSKLLGSIIIMVQLSKKFSRQTHCL